MKILLFLACSIFSGTWALIHSVTSSPTFLKLEIPFKIHLLKTIPIINWCGLRFSSQ